MQHASLTPVLFLFLLQVFKHILHFIVDLGLVFIMAWFLTGHPLINASLIVDVVQSNGRLVTDKFSPCLIVILLPIDWRQIIKTLEFKLLKF
jgi:hypothetical protein